VAERLGIIAQDRVIDFDGRKPNSFNQFVQMLADQSSDAPGSPALAGAEAHKLTIRRGETRQEYRFGAVARLGVNLGLARADAAPAPQAPPN
jgi:hypothetical protein